jgi:hypothetical protein
MLVNKTSKKLHEDIKINSNNSTIKGEHFTEIGLGMTSWECYENKWFYMKCIGKYLSGEILLTRECILQYYPRHGSIHWTTYLHDILMIYKQLVFSHLKRSFYPPGSPEFTQGLNGVRVARSFVLCVMLCR